MTQVNDKEPKQAIPAAEAKKPRSRRWPVVFTFLVAVLAFLGSYALWNEFVIFNKAYTRTAQQTDVEMKRGDEELKQRLSQTDDRLALMEQQLRAMQGKDNMDWLVSEAEYLLRIANHRLILERDVQSALAALQAADARLFESDDPYWIRVRNQIAHELAALQAVQKVDVAGINARLIAVGGAIVELPILQPQRPEPAAADTTPQAQAPQWDGVWADVKARLRQLVVIRSVERPPGPLLAPDQAAFLQQNLLLKLEGAKLALLRGEESSYRDNLAAVKGWIESYYDLGNPLTRDVLKSITDLREVRITPQLPDISESLRLLHEARLKRARDLSNKGGK